VLVAVEPAAAKLLMPNTVRTVANIRAHREWPAEKLRLVLEHWQPAAEYNTHRRRHPRPPRMASREAPARGGTLAACRRDQDRVDTLTAAGVARLTSMPYMSQDGLSVAVGIFGGRAVRRLPRLVSAVSHHSSADKNEPCPLLPNLLPNCSGQAWIKTNEERQSARKCPTDRDVR
jgi:hypothetical protein